MEAKILALPIFTLVMVAFVYFLAYLFPVLNTMTGIIFLFALLSVVYFWFNSKISIMKQGEAVSAILFAVVIFIVGWIFFFVMPYILTFLNAGFMAALAGNVLLYFLYLWIGFMLTMIGVEQVLARL
jgi:hypothetical protein